MRFLLLFTFISVWITPVSAAVPTQLHYNGYLTNAVGEGVDCPDALQCAETFSLTFHVHDTSDSIYDSEVILDNFRWEFGEIDSGTGISSD